MNINEQIDFCKEKTKNIKLRTEPQTFIDIWQSLEELKCFRELAKQGLLLQLPCAPGTPDRKVTTNADRIRNMSDEELAEIITGGLNFDCSDYCDSFSNGCAFRCNKKERELTLTLNWLKSEAE